MHRTVRIACALLSVIATACQRAVRHDEPSDAPAVSQSRADFLKDTVLGVVHYSSGREFDTRKPVLRDSLGVLLKAQRALWQAAAPRDHRFLLRVQCFCPGQKGWQLVEVRGGQLRAWDSSGKAAATGDWSVFTIDQLYDNLLRGLERPAMVNIVFDARWHFPSYVRWSAPVYPDSWSITEIRAFRPN